MIRRKSSLNLNFGSFLFSCIVAIVFDWLHSFQTSARHAGDLRVKEGREGQDGQQVAVNC